MPPLPFEDPGFLAPVRSGLQALCDLALSFVAVVGIALLVGLLVPQ